MPAVVAFLLALMRALPALESLVRQALVQRDQERAREAARRLAAKDAAVDRALEAKP